MPSPYQKIGKAAESLAVDHLKKNGFRILEMNYRNKLGEIDIIAEEGNVVVFIEVKARTNRRFGSPKYAVTSQKQRKISMTALAYLKSVGRLDDRARFDVVTISGHLRDSAAEIIRNAFELAYP